MKDALQQAEARAALDLNALPAIDRESTSAAVKYAVDYPRVARANLRKAAVLPGIPNADGENQMPAYITRERAAGEPIPHVYLKVPTGGGKTK